MHDVTKEEALQFIADAKIVVSKWKDKFHNYIGSNGTAYVDMENKEIRTAFRYDEYDDSYKELLEVLE